MATEGDPVRILYQVVGRRLVDVVSDGTQDHMGTRAISRRRCGWLEPQKDTRWTVLSQADCRRPPGSSGPRLFGLDNPYPRWCGTVTVDIDRGTRHTSGPGAGCLLDAFHAGRAAVLTVEFRTDADKTIRAFYKVVGKRRVEIYYDTTDATSGPRAITERGCRSLTAGEPVLDHGRCRPPAG